MAEVTKLILAVEQSSGIKFEITYDDIGGAAYDRYGYPLAVTIIGCTTYIIISNFKFDTT